MASASHELRALRVKLWNRDPRCHWCGVVTNIEHQDPARLTAADATLDHIYHRGDSRRRVNLPKGEDDVVLACLDCNNRRACAYQHSVRFDPFYLPGKVDWSGKWSDQVIAQADPAPRRYCPSCEASVTRTDVEARACTQCGASLSTEGGKKR